MLTEIERLAQKILDNISQAKLDEIGLSRAEAWPICLDRALVSIGLVQQSNDMIPFVLTEAEIEKMIHSSGTPLSPEELDDAVASVPTTSQSV